MKNGFMPTYHVAQSLKKSLMMSGDVGWLKQQTIYAIRHDFSGNGNRGNVAVPAPNGKSTGLT